MFVQSSSQHKVDEYLEFGMLARLGPSVPEVMGTIDEIIIHKVLSSDAFTLVEDTVLRLDDFALVDLKFRPDRLKASDCAFWITSLGFRDADSVFVYRGEIKGQIRVPYQEGGASSFEPYFVPDGTDSTLLELRHAGTKSKFSARRLALEAYWNDAPVFVRRIVDIPSWTGSYQGSHPVDFAN